MAVHEGTSRLVFAICPAEGIFDFTRKWGGSFLGHHCIRRLYIYRNVFGCPWEDHLELLVLLSDAMDVFMHGNFLSEDNEESTLFGGEKS